MEKGNEEPRSAEYFIRGNCDFEAKEVVNRTSVLKIIGATVASGLTGIIQAGIWSKGYDPIFDPRDHFLAMLIHMYDLKTAVNAYRDMRLKKIEYKLQELDR